MRHFQIVAQNVDVLPVLLDLRRQPDLWNRHTARTTSGVHAAADDIWLRFAAEGTLTSPEAYAAPYVPVWWPAWHALPSLRPMVFALAARLQATEIGCALITRVPPRAQVYPHSDAGRWGPEHFTDKVFIALATNPMCRNTCEDEMVVANVGDAWLFNNLVEHATINDGDAARISLIVTFRTD